MLQNVPPVLCNRRPTKAIGWDEDRAIDSRVILSSVRILQIQISEQYVRYSVRPLTDDYEITARIVCPRLFENLVTPSAVLGWASSTRWKVQDWERAPAEIHSMRAIQTKFFVRTSRSPSAETAWKRQSRWDHDLVAKIPHRTCSREFMSS